MRITPVPPTTTDAAVAPLYASVKAALGGVPNLAQVLGTSPAALQGWLSLNGALATGRLPAALRARIALVVADTNSCRYCLAAHTVLGGLAGLNPAEMQKARHGTASDGYAAAAVVLAQTVTVKQGHVSDADLAAARRGGLDDAAIVEVVVNVALNVLTNYVNHVADTTVDFPAAPALAAAGA